MISCALLLADVKAKNPFDAALGPLINILWFVLIIRFLIDLIPILWRSSPPKRRRKSRKGRKQDLVAQGLSLMSLGFTLIVFPIVFPFKWPIMKLRIVCVAAGVLFIVVALLMLNAKAIKGKIGELVVRSQLRGGLPPDEYNLLNNIYLPIGELGTTQIDHIVVSRFGVFVVETKNFTGWIFANRYWAEWKQVIYHDSSFFQNPMRQNLRHICAIADNLGLPKNYIHGVVAFAGDCEFKTEMPEGVVYLGQLSEYIRGFDKPVLKVKEVEQIVAALKEWDSSVTPAQRRAHVRNLNARHWTKGPSV